MKTTIQIKLRASDAFQEFEWPVTPRIGELILFDDIEFEVHAVVHDTYDNDIKVYAR